MKINETSVGDDVGQFLWNISTCSNFSKKYTKANVVLDSSKYDCFLGKGHSNIGGIYTSNTKPLPCHVRSIWQRSIPELSESFNFDIFNKFIDFLVSENLSYVYFLGDSVTVQFGTILSCDLVKRGVHMSTCGRYWRYMFKNDHSGGCDIIEITNPHNENEVLHRTTIISGRAPSVYRHVPQDRLDKLLHKLFDGIDYSHGRVLVVYNNGLHIAPEKVHNKTHYDLVTTGHAKELLHYAEVLRSHNNSVLAFRETSSQHFASSDGGYFSGVNNSETDFCCKPHSDKYFDNANEIDTDLRRELSRLDPHWMGVLGWIEFYKPSDALVNVHVGLGRLGVDCTHYAYIDGMSTILLNGILKYFKGDQ